MLLSSRAADFERLLLLGRASLATVSSAFAVRTIVQVGAATERRLGTAWLLEADVVHVSVNAKASHDRSS